MKRPTQADVAHLAGVSRATVSYVINGRANGPITHTEETRRRVLEAAAQLGYEPDASAQSLRRGATKSIGALIPDMHNPHYWQIISGVEEAARARGYDLLLTSALLDADRELDSVRSLLRGRVDGLVLALTFPDRMDQVADLLVRRRCPVALLGGPNPALPGLDVVWPGYAEGAAQMMRHLVGLGHRRIGLVHGVACPSLGTDRLTAYCTVLAEAGIPADENLIAYCGTTLADGYAAALRLLDLRPRPTAILVINDFLAVAVLHAAADCGLRVPADLSVASFDDIDLAPYLTPALTTLRPNAAEMGRAALRLVFERMREPERPPQLVHVPAVLVQRASTGQAATGMAG